MDTIKAKLIELSDKYNIGTIDRIRFEDDNIFLECDRGKFKFFKGQLTNNSEQYIEVPLFDWRSKRRYIELRNILADDIVKEPVGMRIKNIRGNGLLDDLIIREIDLIEYILDDEVVRVFSSIDIENQYGNLVLSTRQNTKISMELGVVRDLVEPIEMHEIVCRTGIISDVVVDTQVEHYPIYVYGRDKVRVYTDIDYELYGIDSDHADTIRYILHVIDNISQVDSLRERYTHYMNLIKAVHESNNLVAPVAL